MFTEEYGREIRQYFDDVVSFLGQRLAELEGKGVQLSEGEKGLYRYSSTLLGQKLAEIDAALEECDSDEAEALRFLYSAMPLSDMLDYPAAVYLAYAKHGAFLWKEGPFAGKVPERIFANYVLHHRIHNEDMADTRKFFYDRIADRIAGRDMYGAAVEANYWCVEKATYQANYMRTENPLTMYGTAAGRCGEEAPFCVTALRSIGIPARQVVSPSWSHCDGNHAWVEAWCDGKWHFLGGCEPEDTLDQGWFVEPASRSMQVYSRWFGRDQALETTTETPDMSPKVNQLGLYADTVELTVKVVDGQGNPVPGAKVDFSLLNFARFGSIATLTTGSEMDRGGFGSVKLETGRGDLLVSACGKDGCGECHVSLGEGKGQECTVVIRKEMPGLGQWREMDFHAPRASAGDSGNTADGPARENPRLAEAAKSRQLRMERFYRKAEAERVLKRFHGEDRKLVDGILRQARGNMMEIVRFLEWDFAGRTVELVNRYGSEKWKLEALKALKPNDYWDIRAEVLAECCCCASPYAGDIPEEIFFSSLLNPCVLFETPKACRAALLDALNEEMRKQIRQDPKCLKEILERLIRYLPKREYANLITTPTGCLAGGIGSEVSRDVLCVQIYRTLGIPARMNPMDRTVEYYADGRFVPVTEKEEGNRGTLILRAEGSLTLKDWSHYSLSRLENGQARPVFLMPREGEEEMVLHLETGIYRIVTTNRLKDGDQLVRIYDFRMEPDEEKKVTLTMRDLPEEPVQSRIGVGGYALYTDCGEKMLLSAAGGRDRSLFLWLDLAKEPTEHVLNEMREAAEACNQLGVPIRFVVRRGADYAGDITLSRAREALPGAKVLQDDFGKAYQELCEKIGRSSGKLPLAMVLEGGYECIYSDAGYKVGMADALIRVLKGNSDT